MAGCEAQRLIALSLGKIAMSRQQRGGINLHKNLLVASVLHKARTTYMMDNFQTLIANRKAQAEREAAAKMVVDAPVQEKQKSNASNTCLDDTSGDQVVPSRGVSDCNTRVNGNEVASGERPTSGSSPRDKENEKPQTNSDSFSYPVVVVCSETGDSVPTNKRSCNSDSSLIMGKQPLAQHNENIDKDNNRLSFCRCSGLKRRRSHVDCSDSLTHAKKIRLEEEYDSCDSDSESEADPSETNDYENMHTEQSQVTNLVDIFNSGFSGLYKENSQSTDNTTTGHSGQINVYVSADRPLPGAQFVLKDVSCATQIKESVSIPTAIALAV